MIKKLLTVKSIVTFAITALIWIMAFNGVIEGDKIVLIYSTIIGFYFGTQKVKEDSVK